LIALADETTRTRNDAAAEVVDLERSVVDAESLVDHPLELATNAVAVVAGTDEDVRRE